MFQLLALRRLSLLHLHEWEAIEEIGAVVTYSCECGRSKTRVR